MADYQRLNNNIAYHRPSGTSIPIRKQGNNWHAADVEQVDGRALEKWMSDGNVMDDPDPIPQVPPIDYGGATDGLEDRQRLQQAITILQNYRQLSAPSAAERKTFENTVAGILIAMAKRLA